MTNLMSRCPHCGATDDAGVVHIENGRDAFGDLATAQTYVLCDFRLGGCGASGGVRDTEADALIAWNRRPSFPMTNPVVQILTSMCECEIDPPACLYCQAAHEIERLEKLTSPEPGGVVPATFNMKPILYEMGVTYYSCQHYPPDALRRYPCDQGCK